MEASKWRDFPTTRWTLVRRSAAAGDAETAREALGELCQSYLPVLRGYLRLTLQLDTHRTDDVLQSFLAEKVLKQNVLQAADPQRGRFRTFLLVTLHRFMIDLARRENAAKRRPSTGIGRLHDLLSRGVDDEASRQFDRLWASEVLRKAMAATRHTCAESDREVLWHILESRILLPATTGSAPIPHQEIADQHGLASAAQSANLLTTAKNVFIRELRKLVADYVSDEAEAEEEIRELWQIFSRRRP